MVLERYADLLDTQEKNKGKEGFTVKTNQELEKDARSKVQKIFDRSYDRLKFKVNDLSKSTQSDLVFTKGKKFVRLMETKSGDLYLAQEIVTSPFSPTGLRNYDWAAVQVFTYAEEDEQTPIYVKKEEIETLAIKVGKTIMTIRRETIFDT